MPRNKKIYDCLKHYFGFDKFKGDQEKVIQNVLDGFIPNIMMLLMNGTDMFNTTVHQRLMVWMSWFLE